MNIIKQKNMKTFLREKKTLPEQNYNQQKLPEVLEFGKKQTNNNLDTPSAERQYQNHMLSTAASV